ncbi:MAG: hypothetical protein IPP12_06015 [Nitrospira sp.]|nr:hypothetical protein [Nitrospira sp.]MBL8053039.1 hypothetical protein [Nitrospira sp.]
MIRTIPRQTPHKFATSDSSGIIAVMTNVEALIRDHRMRTRHSSKAHGRSMLRYAGTWCLFP